MRTGSTRFLARFPDGRGDASRPVNDFYRLFMVPGMGHCGGAAGPNRFDIVGPVEQWVEKGTAPEKMIAGGVPGDDRTKTLTRPLCPYPQVAKYTGSGDPNDAAGFVRAHPSR